MSQEQEELIDALVTTTTAWHERIIGAFDLIIATDKSAHIQLGANPEDAIVLTNDDERRGFRIGIIAAKEMVGDLPFKAVKNDPDQESRIETIEVYVFTKDCGDGTATVCYTLDEGLLDRLMETDDEFAMNEGYADTLTFPSSFDLKAAGIHLYEE